MNAYDAEAWHDLFVMVGGATAALAGLIFVAVSLNDEQILAGRKLPGLAARTLGLLVGMVLLSALGLTPQPTRALGVELVVGGAALTALMFLTGVTAREDDDPVGWLLVNLGSALAAALPALVCGITLIAGAGGGLYWLLAEFVAGIVVAAQYAWVLLIEIRR